LSSGKVEVGSSENGAGFGSQPKRTTKSKGECLSHFVTCTGNHVVLIDKLPLPASRSVFTQKTFDRCQTAQCVAKGRTPEESDDLPEKQNHKSLSASNSLEFWRLLSFHESALNYLHNLLVDSRRTLTNYPTHVFLFSQYCCKSDYQGGSVELLR
jgi:hypothetical protein